MAKPQKLPSGKWRIRWFDADGKCQSDTFSTYDLARTAIRDRQTRTELDLERRERFGSSEMTINEAADVYFKGLRRDPNNTERRFKALVRQHRTNFETHIKPHLGTRKLADVTPKVLRGWTETLAATKTARHGEKNETGRTLSASRIRAIATTLRQIAKANDVPLVVMLGDSLKQKRRRRRPKALQTIEQVRQLLGACRQPWFRIAAAIACYCGARLGEVASLRWRHINVESGTVTLELSWEGPLKWRYEDDDDGPRVTVLDPELAALLTAWRSVTHGGPDDRVVLVEGNRPLIEGTDDVARMTRTACKLAQLPPLTFHELRHSYGTILSNQGLPATKLAALMGHADVRTTSIYINPESETAIQDPRARLSGHVADTAPKELN